MLRSLSKSISISYFPFREVVVNGGFIFEWNIFEFFRLDYVLFKMVDTIGGLNFHHFMPFTQAVVFKGLIPTEIFFNPLIMVVLENHRKRRFH